MLAHSCRITLKFRAIFAPLCNPIYWLPCCPPPHKVQQMWVIQCWMFVSRRNFVSSWNQTVVPRSLTHVSGLYCKPRDQTKLSARAVGGTLIGSCMGEGTSSLIWGRLLSALKTLKCFRLRCVHAATWQLMMCGECCCHSVHILVCCSMLFHALLMFGLKEQIRCIFPPPPSESAVAYRLRKSNGGMKLTGENRVLGKKSVPLTLRPLQISYKDWPGIEHGPLR